MIYDVLAPIVTALAGVIAATLSWSTVNRLKQTEVLLKFREQELAIEPRSLDPLAVDRRLRSLAQLVPDAAVVDAWRTLEALANKHRETKGFSSAIHGRQLSDYLVEEGLVAPATVPLLESLWRARNAALHTVDSPAHSPPIDSYLPLIKQLASAIAAKSA